MAQNITLLGASYQDVPSVSLPKTGGGTASFVDVSDTTAVAADVASGKYFYLATGEKVAGSGSGGGGYDIPTFTITFDSSYSTVLSVTCDKTYANCLSIFNSGNNTAMSLITAQGTSDEFYGGVTVTATGTGVITYTGYNVAHPAFDIVYNSNGTMSYVEPSAFVDTLNVTVNGTYYADGDKDWTEVNVNVSGGTSVQTATGTVSGSGTNTLQIPCDFAPDLIYVFGDMTGDASLRGCVSFTIIKDTYLEVTIDGSSSNTDEYMWSNDHNITGYSMDTSLPYGTYSDGTVILDIVNNSSATNFNSAVTYTYKFVKWT